MAQPSFTSSASIKTPSTLVELGAVIVAIILVFWFFVRPKLANVNDQKTAIAQQQQIFNSVETDRQQMLKLVSDLKNQQGDVALVDEALPLDTRITRIQVLIDGLVSASGMQEHSINFSASDKLIAAGNPVEIPQPSESAGKQYSVTRSLDTINFDLAVSGSVDQLKQLLNLVETNGRVIDITDISINSNQGTVTYMLKLKTYSYGAS